MAENFNKNKRSFFSLLSLILIYFCSKKNKFPQKVNRKMRVVCLFCLLMENRFIHGCGICVAFELDVCMGKYGKQKKKKSALQQCFINTTNGTIIVVNWIVMFFFLFFCPLWFFFFVSAFRMNHFFICTVSSEFACATR